MKLRVRINKQTSLVELQGEEPSFTELLLQIREILLPSHGLSPDSEFSLSLNGKEPLTDVGQTLSAGGIVSGDLICMMLPESSAVAAPTPSTLNRSPRQLSSEQRTALFLNEPSASNADTTITDHSSEPVAILDAGVRHYTWDPMLCGEAEDGKVPLSLEVLYCGAQSKGPSDSLIVVVHLLMLETGFMPQDYETKSGEMPDGWRAAGSVYKLKYTHPLCEGSLTMVTAVPMGHVLVINATMKLDEMVEAERKMSLNPSSYVTDEWEGRSAAPVFKDLCKFSRIFKDQLAYALIAAAKDAKGLPAPFGLSILPPELLLRVLRLLDVGSLVALSMVNSYFHAATADSTLWKHLYRCDFGGPDPVGFPNVDWKEFYKRKYKYRKQVQQSRPRVPLSIPPHHFHPLPFPPLLPGIIGGEYDQRPNPFGMVPRPRHDPIGPFQIQEPTVRRLIGRRGSDERATDIRRGFI